MALLKVAFGEVQINTSMEETGTSSRIREPECQSCIGILFINLTVIDVSTLSRTQVQVKFGHQSVLPND